MSKNKLALSILAACSLAFSATSIAAPKTYQVTGPILELNDSTITVQKGKERWEIARDSKAKVTGELKVGDKVTIMYTMSATEIEVKPAKADKAAKTDGAASPSPSASPKK